MLQKTIKESLSIDKWVPALSQSPGLLGPKELIEAQTTSDKKIFKGLNNYDAKTFFAMEHGGVAGGPGGARVNLRLRQHGAETGPVFGLREKLF